VRSTAHAAQGAFLKKQSCVSEAQRVRDNSMSAMARIEFHTTRTLVLSRTVGVAEGQHP